MNYVKVFPRRSTSSSCLNRKAKAAAQRVLDKCKAGDVRAYDRLTDGGSQRLVFDWESCRSTVGRGA